jgi:AAA15 family ATPase/GTPase
MLLSFSVTNYMSIGERQTLSLVATKLTGSHSPFEITVPSAGEGILPCAIIYGPNASGKSNIISAFARMVSLVLHSHAPKRLNSKLPFSPFLLDASWEGQPTTFEIAFMLDGVRYDYSFSHDEKRILSEHLDYFPEGRRRKVFERDADTINFGPSLKGAKKTLSAMTRADSLFLSTAAQHNHSDLGLVAKFFDSPYLSTQLSFSQRYFSSSFEEGQIDPRSIKFLGLIGTGIIDHEAKMVDFSTKQRSMFSSLERVMREHAEENGVDKDSDSTDLFPPDLKEVRIRLAHRNTEGEPIYFDIEDESLGTRRLLEMLSHIFKVLDEGRIAVIDELDASLHTFAVSAIIDLFTDSSINEKNAQLIATTHDTNILNVDHLRRDEIWFVEKARGGVSEYFPLSDFSVRQDEALEKQYLDGRYGAIPSKFSAYHFAKPDAGDS